MADIYKAGNRLTEAGKKELVRLRTEENLKLQEIASRMGLSIGTVWSHLKGVPRGKQEENG